MIFWTPKKLKTKNMGPKNSGVSRTVLTIETKQEIIAKVESGQQMSDSARQYGLNRSTVGTILAKKDIIKLRE
jgi:transposase-like protein